MPATQIEQRDFTDVIAAEVPHTLYDDVRRACRSIGRWAATYARLCETACNRELTSDEVRKRERCEAVIRQVCIHELSGRGKKEQIRPVFQRDPRGATVKLVVPSGKMDDWGQTGICVPTS